jgi:uncharacterized membrane protein (UPF0127 family)
MKKILSFRIHPALGILIVVATAGIMSAILYSETLNLQLAAGQVYQEDVASGKDSYLFILADTPAERSRGLSGADSLPANTVILFSYESNDTCGVWMKSMKFPIDIVWLDENFNVVYFTESLSPATYPRIFYPVSPCRYFIEAGEGFIRANDIRIGSRVSVDFANSLIHF